MTSENIEYVSLNTGIVETNEPIDSLIEVVPSCLSSDGNTLICQTPYLNKLYNSLSEAQDYLKSVMLNMGFPVRVLRYRYINGNKIDGVLNVTMCCSRQGLSIGNKKQLITKKESVRCNCNWETIIKRKIICSKIHWKIEEVKGKNSHNHDPIPQELVMRVAHNRELPEAVKILEKRKLEYCDIHAIFKKIASVVVDQGKIDDFADYLKAYTAKIFTDTCGNSSSNSQSNSVEVTRRIDKPLKPLKEVVN